MNLIWKMSVDAALEFYRRKNALGAITQDECNTILLEMAKEGLIDSLTETKRSKSQIVTDFKKHFNVLDMTNETDAE